MSREAQVFGLVRFDGEGRQVTEIVLAFENAHAADRHARQAGWAEYAVESVRFPAAVRPRATNRHPVPVAAGRTPAAPTPTSAVPCRRPRSSIPARRRRRRCPRRSGTAPAPAWPSIRGTGATPAAVRRPHPACPDRSPPAPRRPAPGRAAGSARRAPRTPTPVGSAGPEPCRSGAPADRWSTARPLRRSDSDAVLRRPP